MQVERGHAHEAGQGAAMAFRHIKPGRELQRRRKPLAEKCREKAVHLSRG